MLKRVVLKSEILLVIGYSLILLFMLVHDWVPMGSLNNVDAIRNVHSRRALITMTSINVGQIFILLSLVLFFIGRKYPIWISIWLVIHPTIIFIGALFSWWIPYLFGYGAEEKANDYNMMFGDTHSFLPIMNGIVPNTLHTLFHLTLLFCILLTCFIIYKKRKAVQ